MSVEFEVAGSSTESAWKIYNFQKPRWEKTLEGFGKMIPQVFEPFLGDSTVCIDPNWVESKIDDQTVYWPPMGKGRFATVTVDFHYNLMTHDQLKYVREILDNTIKSPLFYNRGWGSLTIYHGNEDKASVRMEIFDTLDSQLNLFEDWESMTYLINELQGKIRDHLAGIRRLQQAIESSSPKFSF